jgi:hypothetical protein
MHNYRFIVIVDVEDVPDLEAAYEQLYTKMGNAFGNDWESTDEAYEDDEPVDPDDFLKARLKVFDRLGVRAMRPTWGIPRRRNLKRP